MNQLSQDLRKQTLSLSIAHAQAIHPSGTGTSCVPALLDAWLASLEEEDLAGITPESLASMLWQGFACFATRPQQVCQIEPLRYADGRGGFATALLVVNQDMPFLVDSIVMALRRNRCHSRAVLNAVLRISRDAAGVLQNATAAGATPPAAGASGSVSESYVLVLLPDELVGTAIDNLSNAIRAVAADAAAVHQDAQALSQKIEQVAQSLAQDGTDGAEVAAFLAWAKAGGFEAFGYAYYQVVAGANTLQRDLASRIGVLRDQLHPIYDTSLAGIPEDPQTLVARPTILSVVKADVLSTLHRDQQLDFFGVRATDASGKVLGEHCFIGLFSRAAMATPVTQLPFARGRVQQVLTLAGVRNEGFRAEKFLEILESLPRTEVLEAPTDWLATVCSTVVALYKQPRAMVFVRPDVYGRHLNVLVYMPRERYSATLADRLSTGLRSLSGASDVRSQSLLSDGPLARVHLIASSARLDLNTEAAIVAPLLATIDGWHTAFDGLVDGVTDASLRHALRQMQSELPTEYLNTTAPQTAFRDLADLLGTHATGRVRVQIEVGAIGNVTLRLLARANAPSLSQILPALHNAGVAVDREQTHALVGPDQGRLFVTCLFVDAQSAEKLSSPRVAEAAQELFEALLNNEAEDGRMNGLVIEAGLRQKEVQVIRAYASYWRQAGCRFSLRYIADCLRNQAGMARNLVENFQTRFNPEFSADQRASGTAALQAMKAALADINHADTEDILRSIADLMLATLRTSYFQDAQIGDTIILKFDSSQLALLPQPRPYREIFVFSRRFEGVHLRGGPVARGGLRWSDRMEDYRTEVLGLVKAQMVKNAVIVPAGAKGGFVCKMMPKDAPREVIAQEGEAVYRLFIAGLLDMTDNRVRGGVAHPVQTVCYDDTDPYLVVAADKGTATFSDIANGIAVQRGFWLGDAFASGGSNGYDHKKLGITAKGAWEAVKRHFYEMGHDLQTTPFTMVGIGDMSGDVFGNGVLLSRQLKLVAAFDHRHIFIDPTPDVVTSFAERERMFALPRSSWEDYNKSLISAGGGVWPRSARSIDLSPEARAALGIEVDSLTPEQLLHAILLAPVDLFYNGGIGTYIKAGSETHAQVKDRANDQIRVDGAELRCKVVAEGGNLGATQLGRIEFARRGGRIFTDAIDNSAGVDCSDHEVNVKIWLDTEVNAGSLSEVERNRVLNDITQDIEVLVLRDNRLQTQMLAREEQAQGEPAVLAAYAELISSLEADGIVSRELEQLPTDVELQRRKAEGRGLTAPELAVVIANVKNNYKRILAAEDLISTSWASTLLTPYFPAGLVATRNALDHPLANAILATVLANEAVNRCGPLMVLALARKNHVSETRVLRAWAQAWAALNLAPVFATLDAYALQVPCAVSQLQDGRTRKLQQAVIQGVLSGPDDSHGAVGFAELTQLFAQTGAAQTLAGLSTSNGSTDGSTNAASTDGALPPAFQASAADVDAMLGMADFLFAALSVERPASLSLPALLQLGMRLRAQTGVDRLESLLVNQTGTEAQEALRTHALQTLRRTQQRLIALQLHNPDSAMPAVSSAILDAAEAGAGSLTPVTLEQAVLAVWELAEAA